ncbi:diguanylate cyclase (GGDEF)-like protein [Pseudomonas duriflava]|uniref:diguanylate cyclase n=1 Tax=Pseudomonas duriflava TaxID=459528 RepID=A0A562QP65_9PSED|nr:GGDEF domain-containing protein [Pseudomonas duriflava]TWI58524.1 diguanylate cyclase (GGDEF)-like protein [Pseudomonas duriflava]
MRDRIAAFDLYRYVVTPLGLPALTMLLGLMPAIFSAGVGLYTLSFGSLLQDCLILVTVFLLITFVIVVFRQRAEAWPLEPYVIGSLLFLTYSLTHIQHLRGTFLVFYALLLMLGIFRMQLGAFIRCASIAYFSYTGLCLWLMRQPLLPQAENMMKVQGAALIVTLICLIAFARHHQRVRQQLSERRYALEVNQNNLRHLMHQLETQAITDELTGLRNRRYFLQVANEALHRLSHGRMHGLALIDLDYFKQINDQFGHAAGDEVLKAFASIATRGLREQDVLARYGGEEFVLLLPFSDPQQVHACCERLRQAFSQVTLDAVQGGSLSVSIGISLLVNEHTLDEALQLADQALYRAKRNGRNRCEAAWES